MKDQSKRERGVDGKRKVEQYFLLRTKEASDKHRISESFERVSMKRTT